MRAEHFCTSITAESTAKKCIKATWAAVHSQAVVLFLLIYC